MGGSSVWTIVCIAVHPLLVPQPRHELVGARGGSASAAARGGGWSAVAGGGAAATAAAGGGESKERRSRLSSCLAHDPIAYKRPIRQSTREGAQPGLQQKSVRDLSRPPRLIIATHYGSSGQKCLVLAQTCLFPNSFTPTSLLSPGRRGGSGVSEPQPPVSGLGRGPTPVSGLGRYRGDPALRHQCPAPEGPLPRAAAAGGGGCDWGHWRGRGRGGKLISPWVDAAVYVDSSRGEEGIARTRWSGGVACCSSAVVPLLLSLPCHTRPRHSHASVAASGPGCAKPELPA
jgi:hypothetical protein